MIRKLIKQGNNSYTCTLPIRWIREEQLAEGDEVEINRDEQHVTIKPIKHSKKIERSITLRIEGYHERTLRNIINQLYRQGYDELQLTQCTEKQHSILKDIVRQTMMGFDITSFQKDKCIIQNIAEPSEKRFGIILRRIFLIIKQESEDILNSFHTHQFSDAKMHADIKNSIDEYTNLCRRIIMRERMGGVKHSYLLMIIVSRLSLIQHAYYTAYHVSAKMLKKPSQELIALLKETNALFAALYTAFYNNDLELANKISTLKDRLVQGTIYNLLIKNAGPEHIVIYHIGEIIRLIHLTSTTYFGLIEMDRTFDEESH